MSEKIEVWLPLIKSEVRTELYCPPSVSPSFDEFFMTFNRILVDNQLPAVAQIADVQWDNSDVVQKRIVVRYVGEDSLTTDDLMQCIIGIDQMGTFTYVEEKTFIQKPDLPRYPAKKKDLPRCDTWPDNGFNGCFLGLGIFLLLVALLSTILTTIMHVDTASNFNSCTIACSSVFGGLAWIATAACIIGHFIWKRNHEVIKYHNQKVILEYEKKKKAIERHNKQVDIDTNAWNDAWTTWEEKCLRVAYLSSTDDKYGRFIRAVSSVVKLTIKELYTDKEAQIRERKECEVAEQQLKAELEKRKLEFK